jgi:hypothetical protein
LTYLRDQQRAALGLAEGAEEFSEPAPRDRGPLVSVAASGYAIVRSDRYSPPVSRALRIDDVHGAMVVTLAMGLGLVAAVPWLSIGFL